MPARDAEQGLMGPQGMEKSFLKEKGTLSREGIRYAGESRIDSVLSVIWEKIKKFRLLIAPSQAQRIRLWGWTQESAFKEASCSQL